MTDSNKNKLFQVSGDENQDEVVHLLRLISQSQQDLLDRQAASDRKQEELQAQINAMADRDRKLREELSRGFPNDDPNAHREYHEKLIRAADATTQMMTELKFTIIKRGVLGAFYVLVILVLMGIFSKDGLETAFGLFRELIK